MRIDSMKKQHGIRITKQRRVLLDQIDQLDTHLTADQLYNLVRKKIPNISLGTVYRNLEILSGAGLVKKLNIDGERSYYDGGLHDHYHARCVNCGRIKDVSADQVGDLDSEVHIKDFNITGHELVFVGLCSACGKKG